MLEFFRSNEIDQIFAYEMMQKFAFSLISIFIPIYLANTVNLATAFGFLLVQVLSLMIASFPVSYTAAKIGFKHSLVISYLFYVPAFLAFQLTEYGSLALTNSLIFGVAVVLGTGKAFHWLALNAEFAVDSTEDTRGSDSGKLLGLPRISRAIAPFAGGLIMKFFGFGLLVSVTFFFLLMSAIPLFASKDHRDPLEYSLRSLLNMKHLIYGSLFVFRGVGITVGKFIFSLFVALEVSSAASGSVDAGAAQALASVGMAGFTLVLGNYTDRIRTSYLIIAGTISSGILFAARAFITVPIEAFVISFIAGLAFMLYYVPVYSKLADAAEAEDVLEFYAFREIALGIGRVFTLVGALYITLNYSIEMAYKFSFGLAAIATTMVAFYAKKLER